MNILKRITDIIIRIYLLLLFLAAAAVLAASVVSTVVFRLNEQNDLFDFRRENVPLLLLLTGAAAALFFLLGRTQEFRRGGIAGKTNRVRMNLYGKALLWFAFCTSLFLVLVLRGKPTNDALQLDQIIGDFLRGDYSAMKPGGYLDSYPFQIFYVMTGMLLQLIFGPSNYMVYQLLNVLSIVLTLYFLYEISFELFHDPRVCSMMSVMAFGAMFLYVYATFIYSDIWSFASMTGAALFTMRYFRTRKIRQLVFAGLLCALSVVLKSNAYILMLAMLAALLVDTVRRAALNDRKESLRSLLAAVLILVLVRGSVLCVNTGVERMTGMGLSKGVPASTYFAMGMEEMEGKYGWYDGTNVGLYHNADNQYEAADRLAKEKIHERAEVFRENPKYFVKFYLFKFLSQWADPTCVSMREFEESGRHVDNQSALAASLIFGRGSRILQWIMNVYETLVYLGLCVYLLCRVKGRKTLTENEVLLTALIFGGVVFHQLWEASGRYAMRYYICMLPLAAFGMLRMLDRIAAGKGLRTQQKQ